MVYRYKATIPGNKIFMREYEMRDSASLYSCHTFLLNDLGFSPDQMVLFRALDKKGKVKKEFGLFDLGDGTMDSVSLLMLDRWGLSTLEYVYDMFKDRSLRLDLISTEEELPKRSYPRLVGERGKNPDQLSDNYDDFEQMLESSDSDTIFEEPANLDD
ncbi:hypothetical protein SDC9_131420 [bioreactor metagenome]|uniref:Uncharacterized protein n=1 Tax=bioreactor metagenome TaxID=1076179 RepID=A0A645D551_9ZZZZ